MDQNPKKNEINQKERRNFLKKTVYAAPKIIVLGTLLRPNNANADLGLPPSLDEKPAALNEQPASFGGN